MNYWKKQRDLDPHDLDQVGITLERRAGGYFIAGIVRRAGKPTVEGIVPGDKLIQIDGLATETATRGAVLAALHGAPGGRRVLTIERAGQQLQVSAPVTGF
jgi:C-terminal processing protease CtpA/Prc